jgi:hypothetical protein
MPGHRVQTSITITAPPDWVWRVLVDFSSWTAWNVLMDSISGEARLGSVVRYRPNIEGARRRGYTAQIVRCEAYREFVWLGAPFQLSALGWGEHWFRLEASAEGTLFQHGECFGGLLSYALPKAFFVRIAAEYEVFNLALKVRAEAP